MLRLYFNYQAVLSPSAILRLHETHSFILLTSFSGLWDVPPLSPKLAVKTLRLPRDGSVVSAPHGRSGAVEGNELRLYPRPDSHVRC